MKPSPNIARLEEVLRASKIAGGGFLGDDQRPLAEILDSDATELARTGRTVRELVMRMREITVKAETGLGSWVKIGEGLEAAASDTRGFIPCPWPHSGVFSKTVVTVRNGAAGETVRWSELSIHLIEEHGFFQGRGSAFRLVPAELVAILF